VSSDYKIPQSFCPACDYRMEMADNVHGGGAPDPGDCSVCLNCGQLLIFTDDLTLRVMTAAEVKEWMSDAEAWRAIDQIRRTIEQRGPLPARMRA
jgi:hypothetical protein